MDTYICKYGIDGTLRQGKLFYCDYEVLRNINIIEYYYYDTELVTHEICTYMYCIIVAVRPYKTRITLIVLRL